MYRLYLSFVDRVGLSTVKMVKVMEKLILRLMMILLNHAAMTMQNVISIVKVSLSLLEHILEHIRRKKNSHSILVDPPFLKWGGSKKGWVIYVLTYHCKVELDLKFRFKYVGKGFVLLEMSAKLNLETTTKTNADALLRMKADTP